MDIEWDVLERALSDDEYVGFCLECGEESYNVEPDAECYRCDACGQDEVYGAQQILIMGRHTGGAV